MDSRRDAAIVLNGLEFRRLLRQSGYLASRDRSQILPLRSTLLLFPSWYISYNSLRREKDEFQKAVGV